MAQAYRRLGSRVTVVERNEKLIHREDPDVTTAIGELFHDEGVEVFTGTKISRIDGETAKSVRLHATAGGQSILIEGSHLLIAAGRTPNTDGIGLAQAAIEVDARGHVKVNERLQTTAPGVWAVEIVLAARISHMLPTTTFELSETTSKAETASPPVDRCHSACS